MTLGRGSGLRIAHNVSAGSEYVILTGGQFFCSG